MVQELEIVQKDIVESCKQHEERYRDEVVLLLRDVERAYTTAIGDITSIFAKNSAFVPLLDELRTSTSTYLTSMRWIGWGNCELGPPLGIRPVEDYALAMAVYTSARLIDDALDGHTHYKGLMPTLHHFLCQYVEEREAAGLGSMMGCFIAQEAVYRILNRCPPDTALLLLQLYAEIVPGAMAEILAQGMHSADVYKAVVQRKSVAYDMMLHRVFLQTAPHDIQTILLQFLSVFSETAQWLNDFTDRDDDLQRQQLNFVHSTGIDEKTAYNRIAAAFIRLWHKARILPAHIRNALAMRLRDPVALLLSSAPQPTVP